jgi:HEAT repeat protein
MEVLHRDSDPTVRAQAAFALGRLKDPRAVGALIDALADRGVVRFDRKVCHRAAEALVRIGTEAALAAVEEWYEARGVRPTDE